ncbi:MAG: peptidoglycan DL-endopeptidase RipB [Solirubrobacteraceae bacterium]|nr:peptidoglycan DL-endopeptidase RipB [Solirubrobacteraceae bacterium]
MRSAAAFLSIAAFAVAGCGSSSPTPTHSARQPTVAPESHVFTIPAKLPPRATPAKPVTAKHNPGRGVAPAVDPTASAGAPTDAEVQRDLAKALGLTAGDNATDQAGLSADGYASVPPSAPPQVAAIITAANQVARAPYRYGGGHGGVAGNEIWVDSAYDCSASVSFALASAKLVSRPLDSTSFMSWGRPGPGKWVTVFANHGHAFMVVAGLRFDTVERARTGTRWGQAYSKVTGFSVRHPAGL